MKSKKFESLSFRIMASIILTSIISIAVVFITFERINREAFYKMELEKATLILKTVEPLVAIDMYLGLENKMKALTQQLMKNKDILSIEILQNNITVYKIKSKHHFETLFVAKEDILQPNTKRKIGTIVIHYSNENYTQLVHKYTIVVVFILMILLGIFIILSFYIKNLLQPLRNIAKMLQDFSPTKKINIETVKENNEVALILSALSEMQEKIFDYASKQKDINVYLEKEVDKKTTALKKQFFVDDLTQLPNRKKLFEDINNSTKENALLILNIDDFKEINDFYGQEVGDFILKKFAKRLQKFVEVEPNISLSRLSGDEFALFFEDVPSHRTFMRVVNSLSKEVEKMLFLYEENEIYIRVTMGGAVGLKGVLEKADIALKVAKEHKKYFLFYDEKLEVERQYKENMQWVTKLKSAIKEDRIVPYFQPIFEAKTKKVASYECLIRLIDVDGSIISPFKFLTIAKKSKVYTKLTKIMIEKSCKSFSNVDSSFSVNLSIDDILNTEIITYIKATVEKYNVNNKIVFEILETEGIDNYEEVASFIAQMKKIGCRISIDDFGSGYSNFEHILKLDIDYIKIDGSLIKNLDTDENARIVVETIVDFAKKMNLITIAEFVHNQAVFEKVKSLDIERIQGFYLAEPDKEILLEN